MKRDIVELYSYFISKVYYHKSYEFFKVRLTDSINRSMVNFLIELSINDIEVSRDYLFDYCGFQFEYMLSKVPRYKENRIPFTQIFNKVGIQRWIDKKEGYMYYVGESLRKKGIDRSDIIPPAIVIRDPKDLIKIEEIEKQRFLNSEKGLSHCLISTSLYNSNSSICLGCVNRDRCKILLKENYISIYIDRGYEF